MQCVAVAAEHTFFDRELNCSIESFRLSCFNNRPSPHFHASSQLCVYETPSGTPKHCQAAGAGPSPKFPQLKSRYGYKQCARL